TARPRGAVAVAHHGTRIPGLANIPGGRYADLSRQGGRMRIIGAVLETVGAEPPFAASHPITVSELELNPPGPGELLVRIEAAGICHSDLSVVDGNRPRPVPLLLGHEAAGIVEAIGPGASDLAVGTRV